MKRIENSFRLTAVGIALAGLLTTVLGYQWFSRVRAEQSTASATNKQSQVSTINPGQNIKTSVQARAAAPGRNPTGSLNTARNAHTATLLPSGSVLVAGGSDLNTSLNSAELYDPVTGSWSQTGSLNAARSDHTATLLQTGKVLVVGGFGVSNAASAELYNPATKTWSVTGPLATSRFAHTATLLPNGKVLIAGGHLTTGAILNSAELYDPATGTWTATGALTTSRDSHTATLLTSGKVLVAGGAGQNSVTVKSAELYDQATGQWSPAGDLATPRVFHTATLVPSGKVLAVGGGLNEPLRSAELYDPATNTWSAAASLATPRSRHTATLLPTGKVLVTGTIVSLGGNLRVAELYDPTVGTWTATDSLITGRGYHTATLLSSGQVLLAGGNPQAAPISTVLNTAELYEPASGAWSVTGSLSFPRASHTATLLPSGQVLVAGGFDNSQAGTLRSAELYAPTTGVWSATGLLATARYLHTATLLPSGKVLVTGGRDDGFNDHFTLKSAELYDPATGQWSATASLASVRYSHTATLLPSGKVLVVGGFDDNELLKTAELYDPTTDQWSATGNLATARYLHTATLLPSGKVLVVGGHAPNETLKSAELYDPATGIWSATGSLSDGHQEHTATLLSSGKVLVAGGSSASSHDPYPPDRAELYDPATSVWSVTGTLNPTTTGQMFGQGRRNHTATLLPSGKVLVLGNEHGNSVDVYDPATGVWSLTASLLIGDLQGHTATLLPTGKVLLAGGATTTNLITSAELYDSGLGFQAGWQPIVKQIRGTARPEGSPVTLPTLSGQILPNWFMTVSGSNFKGVSEASGGSTQNSATNYPLVELRSLVNEQKTFLSPAQDLPAPLVGWSATSFISSAISNFPNGFAIVTVYANAVPSASQIILIGNAGTTTTLSSSTNQSMIGQPVTLTAIVSTLVNSIPISQVAFSDGETLLGTELVDRTGKATFTTTSLKPGTHSAIKARYLGGIGFTGSTGTLPQDLVVNCPTVVMLPATLPGAFVNQSYNQQLTATGGTAPYTFTISEGNPPTGLRLSSDGKLSGTPSEPGSFTFVAQATDKNGCTKTNFYTIGVKLDQSTITVNTEEDTAVANDGKCTLREAINNANATGQTAGSDCAPGSQTTTIGFANSVAVVNLQSALPDINSNLIINGPGRKKLAVARGGQNDLRIFTILAGRTVMISGLTIRNGKAQTGAGIMNSGTLSLADCLVFGNTGVGVYSAIGTLTINNSIIDSNTDGGLNLNSGELVMTNSTVSSNTSSDTGAGVNISGISAKLTNCTISGNSSRNSAGAILIPSLPTFPPTVELTHCTIVGNRSESAKGFGAITHNGPSITTIALRLTLVADNVGGNFSGAPKFRSNRNNLDSDGTSGFTSSGGDTVGSLTAPINARLAPLADNGGPTPTHALLAGSQAIDRGIQNDPSVADQRGATRPADGTGLGVAISDIGAYELSPRFINAAAGSDANDGLSPSKAFKTIAKGIAAARDGDTLLLAAGLYQENNLVIGKNIGIHGVSAAATIVDGGGLNRVFQINGDQAVTLGNLTITGGKAVVIQNGFKQNLERQISTGQNGGGISNSGTLTIFNSTITANSTAASGGGVWNDTTGTLILRETAVSNNRADSGGGIGTAGYTLIYSSTINGNTATANGGGLDNLGTTILNNSTLSGNTANGGGGLRNTGSNHFLGLTNCTVANNTSISANGGGGFKLDNGGVTQIQNTLIADNRANGVPSNFAKAANPPAILLSLGHNLDTDGTSGLPRQNGDRVGSVAAPILAQIGPLADNGGPTQTHALLSGSQAINNGGQAAGITTDQRGVARPIRTSATIPAGGDGSDIGAYEFLPIFGVNDLGDTPDNMPGDGVCADTAGNCTLRAAIQEATFGGQIVINVRGTIKLASALPQIVSFVTITGSGPDQIEVRRNSDSSFRIFSVRSDTWAIISGVRMANGMSGASGGGILNQGALTLNNCVIAGNVAVGSGGGVSNQGVLLINDSSIASNQSRGGGGIINQGGELVMNRSTISGNISRVVISGGFPGPGGLWNLPLNGGSGTSILTNCTISGNHAETTMATSGGIDNTGEANNVITLINCTIADNTYTNAAGVMNNGGAIYLDRATANIRNTIISGNTGPQIFKENDGQAVSQGGNIVSDGSGGLTGPGDRIADPKLAPLGNYGGPTETHALIADSPAINAGVIAGAPTTDQRSVARGGDGGVDVGAFESHLNISPATLPAGTVGAAYKQNLAVTGGPTPFSFSLLSGALPGGLKLDAATGAISGTPVAGGSFDFVIKATDAGKFASLREFRLTINCAGNLAIGPTALLAAALDLPYSQSLVGVGGRAPNSFSLLDGALPDGLTLLENGLIQGTPKAPGLYTFTVSLTDASLCPASRSYTLAVHRRQKLTDSVGDAENRFGAAVVINSDTAIVGAELEDISGRADQGAAYVYVRRGSLWTLQSKLTASFGAAGERFGHSVAISGDTAIIGAEGWDKTKGAAYIFVRNGGSWSQQFKLIAADGAALDRFGASVAISGDTVAVGAKGASQNQGAAYVFVRNDPNPSVWKLQKKLTAPDGEAGDVFGSSVSISDSTVIIGTNGDNQLKGSAYVFLRNGQDWAQQQKLSASDGAVGDQFGGAVAINGETAVVGAHNDTVGSNGGQGSAYVFTRSGSVWTQQAQLTAGDGAESDFFGMSVALSGDRAVIGASSDTVGNNFAQGSAHIFVRSGVNWTEQSQLTASDGAARDFFGVSVGISGGAIIVGASNADIGMNANQGAARIFDLNTPIAIGPAILAEGRAGSNYSQNLSGSGGIDPYQFSIVEGALPSGLALSPASLIAQPLSLTSLMESSSATNWTLSGVPMAPGTFNFTLKVVDQIGNTGTQNHTLVIRPACVAITVNPEALQAGKTGDSYNQALTAAGGTAPHSFNLIAGNLPGGLTLTREGSLAGVPTASGSFVFAVGATDAGGCIGNRSYLLTINMGCPAITITPTTLPMATQKVAYNQTLTASGGAPPYSFSATGLPAGLTLSSGGAISGAIATSGSFNFTVTVKDVNGCEARRNYSLIVDAPSVARTLRIGSASGSAGGTVVVPIELASQGNENAIALSLNFDPAVLKDPQPTLGDGAIGALANYNTTEAAAGRLGLVLALPSGQSFAAGVRRVFNISFSISANSGASVAGIGFGDQPIRREIVNTTATALTAEYISGSVTIGQGFPLLEADVAPRSSGDGKLSVSDWTMLGMLLSNSGTSLSSSEFQRADCAPKETRGDGRLTAADWVQAGRYVAGLDSPAEIGGPTAPVQQFGPAYDQMQIPGRSSQLSSFNRRPVNVRAVQFGAYGIAIELDSSGTENALSFSLSFDPKTWRFAGAETGSGADGASLAVVKSEANEGRLGVIIALPSGRRLAAGSRQLVVVRFDPISDFSGSINLVGFADQPLSREVVDVAARVIPALFTIHTDTIQARAATVVSAASLRSELLASESLVTSFGEGLATLAQTANVFQPMTELAGTRVWVRDSSGVERQAAIASVFPEQVTFQIPADTAEGFALITIISGDGAVSVGTAQVAVIAPSIFSIPAGGLNLAAGVALRIRSDGSQQFEPMTRFDAAEGRFVAEPLDLGSVRGTAGEQVFLILSATGLRHAASQSVIQATLGGEEVAVWYAGTQGDLLGLDQLNLLVPSRLAGRGAVELRLSVNGRVANVVQILLK